jgi:hypothetical protein
MHKIRPLDAYPDHQYNLSIDVCNIIVIVEARGEIEQ